jgi:acetyl-CoA carboxylase carboxyltransferase component
LHKAAQDLTHKQELINTGVIAGLGTATGFAAHKAMNSAPKMFGQGAKFHNAKIMALSGAAGLAADYAGVKLNKQINKHVQ